MKRTKFRIGERVKIVKLTEGFIHAHRIGSTGEIVEIPREHSRYVSVIVDNLRQLVPIKDVERLDGFFLRLWNALVAIFCAPDVRDRYDNQHVSKNNLLVKSIWTATSKKETAPDDDDSEGMAMIQRELDSY